MHYYQADGDKADGDRRNVSLSSVSVNIRSRIYAEGYTIRRQLRENVPSVPDLSDLSVPDLSPICPDLSRHNG